MEGQNVIEDLEVGEGGQEWGDGDKKGWVLAVVWPYLEDAEILIRGYQDWRQPEAHNAVIVDVIGSGMHQCCSAPDFPHGKKKTQAFIVAVESLQTGTENPAFRNEALLFFFEG